MRLLFFLLRAEKLKKEAARLARPAIIAKANS
jgi:hypothetical protein